MKERPKYYIFQKALFCTLASITKLGLNAVPVAAEQYLRRDFTFFFQKLIIFRVSMHFKRSKDEKKNFQTILVKIFVDFFTV